jgi:hypothetical protein
LYELRNVYTVLEWHVQTPTTFPDN